MNDFVPSMGSRIQRKPLVPLSLGQFFAEDTVVGKRYGDAATQVFFGPAIGCRYGRIVAFQLDIEILAGGSIRA